MMHHFPANLIPKDKVCVLMCLMVKPILHHLQYCRTETEPFDRPALLMFKTQKNEITVRTS